jgi:hypothetical protein
MKIISMNKEKFIFSILNTSSNLKSIPEHIIIDFNSVIKVIKYIRNNLILSVCRQRIEKKNINFRENPV